MRTVDETIKAVRSSLESPHTRTWAPIFYPEAEALFVEIEEMRRGRAKAEADLYHRNRELEQRTEALLAAVERIKGLRAEIDARDKSAARAFRKARRAK